VLFGALRAIWLNDASQPPTRIRR